MTVTSIAAESLAKRCAICARPAHLGASLCAQCKAAVKRARQVPSLHPGFLPQAATGTGRAGLAASGDPCTRSARRALRTGLPPIPGGWGIYVTLIAFGAAVSIAGYFATDQQEEASRERAALAARTASAAVVPVDAGPSVQAPATSRVADEPAPGEAVVVSVEWTVPPAPPARSPGTSPRRKPVREAWSTDMTRTGTEARNPEKLSLSVPAAPTDAVAASPVESAPETQAVSKPDHWQLLAATMSRCDGENVLVALFCKERARLQYCEGHWGAAPPCQGVALGKNTR